MKIKYTTLLKLLAAIVISGSCSSGAVRIYPGLCESGNCRNGIGAFTKDRFGRKNSYTGEFKNGEPNGKGKIVFESGYIYTGEIQQGYAHGEGELTFPDHGSWEYNKHFKSNGNYLIGTYYPPGSARESFGYIGKFKNGLKHGFGKESYSNGNVYEGNWENGKRHGQGTFYFMDGSVYVGDWYNDFREGNGKYTKPDGASYDGEWRDDKPNGEGVYKLASGRIIKGLWKDGEHISEK